MFSCKKCKKKIEILALLILILIINSTFQYKNFSKNSPLQKDFSESLKPAYYKISPIYIKDDDPAQDWAYHESHYPWCSGSGAKNDPYIIDNVFIDAGGVGNCIRILNSDVYFIIQNSILNNSVHGIDLDYADNGLIQNNTISSHGQHGIIWGMNSDNITIHNNTFSNNYRGIRILSFCENVIITNNIFSNSVDYNIYLTYAYDGRLSHNLIDNGQRGIYLYECKRHNITDNIVRNIVNEGIELAGSDDDHIVSNNILTNNLYGIRSSSTDNIFYNNTATSNSYGMSIGGGGNRVINNSLYSNSIGLSVYGGGKYVSHNNVSLNGRGIYLTGSGNNFTGNIVNDNSQDGMYMTNSDGNYIYQNSFSHNGDGFHHGIYMEGGGGICENNKIIQNEINDNAYSGIYLWDYCENNEIYGNNISSNHVSGIELFDYIDWNTISSNYISNNYIRGLWFVQRSDNNFVFNNTILNNDVGVRMQSTNYYNNFSNNIIEDNIHVGISIEVSTTSFNLFYENYFINNFEHVADAGFLNYWNSSTIGNYWDDNLVNIDSNDDGIGEYPYNITLSPLVQDFLPIFEDGDDPPPPIISILSPSEYELTGINSPNYEISILGLYVHTKWYELIGGSTNITVTENFGKINQTLWEEFGNGTVTLRFNVNDTLGYSTSDEITFRKDIYDPTLSIIGPIDDTLYGNTAPIFNVELADPNLDTSWYSLDGGITNIVFITNSSINQTVWDNIPDGQIEIQFYVNDTAGNLIFDSVSVRKDTHTPVITITSPNSSDLFGNSTISFNVEIFDLNLEKMWYTIVGSLTNITFTSNGTIDTALWNSFGSGDLTLVFYANDTNGRISTNNIIISKDIDPPSISIINPTSGETFYVTPPEFEITVSDAHLELVWYTIDGGVTNINVTQYTDFIDQSIWDAAPQGDIILRFNARDSLGNTRFVEITIKKASITQQQPLQEIPGYYLPLITVFIALIVITKVVKFKRKLY